MICRTLVIFLFIAKVLGTDMIAFNGENTHIVQGSGGGISTSFEGSEIRMLIKNYKQKSMALWFNEKILVSDPFKLTFSGRYEHCGYLFNGCFGDGWAIAVHQSDAGIEYFGMSDGPNIFIENALGAAVHTGTPAPGFYFPMNVYDACATDSKNFLRIDELITNSDPIVKSNIEMFTSPRTCGLSFNVSLDYDGKNVNYLYNGIPILVAEVDLTDKLLENDHYAWIGITAGNGEASMSLYIEDIILHVPSKCFGFTNPSACNGHGSCTSTDVCLCYGNRTGAQCETCIPGYYSPDCVACNCVHGTCDEGIPGTGSCSSCDAQWEGENCDIPACVAASSNLTCSDSCITQCSFLSNFLLVISGSYKSKDFQFLGNIFANDSSIELDGNWIVDGNLTLENSQILVRPGSLNVTGCVNAEDYDSFILDISQEDIEHYAALNQKIDIVYSSCLNFESDSGNIECENGYYKEYEKTNIGLSLFYVPCDNQLSWYWHLIIILIILAGTALLVLAILFLTPLRRVILPYKDRGKK